MHRIDEFKRHLRCLDKQLKNANPHNKSVKELKKTVWLLTILLDRPIPSVYPQGKEPVFSLN